MWTNKQPNKQTNKQTNKQIKQNEQKIESEEIIKKCENTNNQQTNTIKRETSSDK